MTTRSPLADVRVLDLSRFAPGGFCTLLLADLGADVVKVEDPRSGDGLRGMYRGGFDAAHIALNRGKRTIGLDLRADGASMVLERLVAWADVAIDSHRPGQLDRFGLGYAAMSAANPAIAWCSITGFGDFGPNTDQPGHDLTYLGYSGLLSRLSDSEPTPPRSVISIPLAATMAATGILAALHDVSRTGQGTHLDVNMTDSAMWVLSEDIARAANAPGPAWGTFAARNVYRCADGRHVTVTATEPKAWAALCDALGDAALAGHRLGLDEDAPVRARLEALFATKPASDWLADPGLPGGVGPVNDAADLLTDPQVTDRGSLTGLDDSDIQILANPMRFEKARGDASNATSPPPDLGAHTDDVLREAGFTQGEIDVLRAAGTVA
ncbi:MAG: CaiB/BaiF CoA-transferase family protein [Acidimicrobiales bacterium]|nr:CaiB/BaiF CoA-transferase family protein [Acidimicrobiales bacterium]